VAKQDVMFSTLWSDMLVKEMMYPYKVISYVIGGGKGSWKEIQAFDQVIQ